MSPRRQYTPPQIEQRQFSTPEEIEAAIRKLRRRIDEVKNLDPTKILYNDQKINNAERAIQDTILDIYGEHSPEYQRHRYHDIWEGGYIIGDDDSDMQRKFAAGIPQTVTMLEGLIARLEEKREDLRHNIHLSNDQVATVSKTRRVFIVFGHDAEAKDSVARLLETLRLDPIILHEQASKGRTIIEKFEGHSVVDFAVVLLTPDDIGFPAGLPDEKKPRARQNVIFELGYFFGKLGRSRVCALYKGNVEILSDYDGVIYVRMDNENDWRLQLAKEIKAAGIEVDLNRLVHL
jgi:predicted nucleotide-binding protein